MSQETPTTLQSMQEKDPIKTRYTKRGWGRDEYVWFDGYEWQSTSAVRKADPTANWIKWKERARVVLWLNVYPKSVQVAETKDQADAIAQEGRIARKKLAVEQGEMDE